MVWAKGIAYRPQNLKLMAVKLCSQLSGVKRPLQGCSYRGQSLIPFGCRTVGMFPQGLSARGIVLLQETSYIPVTCPVPPLNQ